MRLQYLKRELDPFIINVIVCMRDVIPQYFRVLCLDLRVDLSNCH